MEKKHVCKHCFKRFPCGKSLGGHIRTHMSEERTTNADNHDAAFNFNLKLDAAGRRKKRDLWSESEASIYGLRENPKKTMRFVHSDSNANAAAAVDTNFEQHEVEEKLCKECGKGFPSLKALCGHMACHSDKDKKINSNNNTKVTVMDTNNTSSQSDTTDNCVPRRSKRFKSLTLSNHKNNNPSSLAYASSPEQEEAENGAKCLILLSKDPNLIHIDHFATQNNLPLLDTKSKSSSSFDTNVESRKRGNHDSIGDNGKRENSCKYERLVSESDDDDDDDEDDSADYESDENSSETDSYDSKAVMMNGKKKKSSKVKKKLNLKLKSKKSSKEHECPICYRIFKSGQALGGHKRSHFVGGSSDENSLVIKQASIPIPVPVPVPVPCLIDLNLPAPVDE